MVTSGLPDIETPRLILRSLPAAALAALVAGDRALASRQAGCDLSDFRDDALAIAALRLNDLTADPDYLPWSLRAMLLKPDLMLVGHCNFHSKPGAAYLAEVAPDLAELNAVELGYSVLPAFRRRGFAEEAAWGLMDWAGREHGVRRFVVSISPENAASVAMARKLGFARISGHIDTEDGYEDILVKDWRPRGEDPRRS